MTNHEYQAQQRRVTKFYAELPKHFFADERTFTGMIAVSSKPVPYSQRESVEYQPAVEGLHWGELWDSAWVRLDGEIPSEWKGRKIMFRINLGGEVLVFDAKGIPVYSLTNTSSLVRQYRKEYMLYSQAASPGRFSVWMEAAANGLFGSECGDPDYPDQKGEFGTICTLRYGILNQDVWDLRLDIDVIMGLLHFPRTSGDFGLPDTPAFPPGSAREKQIMAILSRAIDYYRNDPANAAGSRGILCEVLKQPALHSAMTVTAVGHAHIDTGWLWPVSETVRKCARTFASQLTLMEKYPDYVFGASQAQHYLFIKEHYPELHEKIKARVKEGRWEIQGAMWVECDCNLTGGEALIRQFLHGKNFFRQEFGVDVKNLWLPDVFGYSAALPQIIRKTGCNRFLTQKLSWNDTNKFPYHCFNWVGIDGSRVLSFFPPEDNYNAILAPDMLNYGVNNFSQNELIPEILSLFGIGDGGGGPKEEYLERGGRCADLEGCPRVRFGRADEFLERLGRYEKDLPVWRGELYLEKHRGTLTVQAQVKRDNRQCEQLLLAVENLYSRVSLEKYPTQVLDKLWKMLMINQFHDILPGSSIHSVYERTQREHHEIKSECRRLIRELGDSTVEDTVTMVNTLGTAYRGVVPLPEGWEAVSGGMVQKSLDGRTYTSLQLPSFGNKILRRASQTSAESSSGSGLVLENQFVRYEFSETGELLSIFHKEKNHEFLVEHGNVFSLYHDIPNVCDAWDIESWYPQERVDAGRQLLSVSQSRCGELFSEFLCEFRMGDSTVRQLVRLENNSPRLDFITEVDWRENRRMLRVAFPTSIFNGHARFDIQYGFVERPTHRNTSWERAQFEVCMHQYVDLSREDCGLALLNDCKYGVSVYENRIDLNLLRSPVYPDPLADRGQHQFTYSLFPHSGDFREAGVQLEAAALNRPPCVIPGTPECEPAANLEQLEGFVVIESVKRAENENALVLRLVERHGRPARCQLHLQQNFVKAMEADMCEWNLLREFKIAENNTLTLELTPFEIKTVMLFPAI